MTRLARKFYTLVVQPPISYIELQEPLAVFIRWSLEKIAPNQDSEIHPHPKGRSFLSRIV